MAKGMKGRHKLVNKLPKKLWARESNLKKIFANVHKRNEADGNAEDRTHDEKEYKDIIKNEDVDEKKVEEELINRFLGPEYKDCNVHLTHCDIDVRFKNCMKNLSNETDYKINLISTGNKKVVHHNMKVQNKKIKLEKISDLEEDNSSVVRNSSETETSKKLKMRRNRRLSGDSCHTVSSDSSNVSSQHIFNSCEYESISVSSVSDDLEDHNKRRKSSVTDDEDNDYRDNCSRKKPCIIAETGSKKTLSKRNSRLVDGRKIYRSEKQRQLKSVHSLNLTESEKLKEEQFVKTTVPPVCKETLCNKNEHTFINTGLSRKKLIPVKNNSGVRCQNGKLKFTRTPAEKKMYDEKVQKFELVKVGKQDKPKNQVEHFFIRGSEHNDTEVGQCNVIRKISNKNKQQMVKVPAANNDVKSGHKLGNAKNVKKKKMKKNKLPLVVMENEKSRFDGQTDVISGKDCDNANIDMMKFPENAVTERRSELTAVSDNRFENVVLDLLKHDEEGDDDNNNDDISNICRTKHDNTRNGQDIITLASSSDMYMGNLNSTEKMDCFLDKIITDNMEQLSKNGKRVQCGSVRSDKCNTFSTGSRQHIKGEREVHCRSSGDGNQNRSAVEPCNVKISSERNLPIIVHRKEVVNSDNIEPSSNLETSNDDNINHAEQDQSISSTRRDEPDESTNSSDEEDKSVSDSDKVHRISTVIQNRTSSDSDRDDTDNEQIHYTTNVKRSRTINASDCNNDEQRCSMSNKTLEQNVSNQRRVNIVGCKWKNRIISDSDDDEGSGDSQYNSLDDQDESFSDSKQGHEASDDEGRSLDSSNEFVNQQCSDNHMNNFSDEKKTDCVTSDVTEKCRSEKISPAPAVLGDTLVQSNTNSCDDINKVLSADCDTDRFSACVNSLSKIDGGNSSDDSDDWSDILSLCADSMIMDFISTRALPMCSVPNPFLPAQKLPEKNIFMAKDDHHYNPLNSTTDAINNRFSSTDNGVYSFGGKAIDNNRTIRNNVLPEVLYGHEKISSDKSETVVSNKMIGEVSQNRYGCGYNNNGNKPFSSYAYNRFGNKNIGNTDNNITAGVSANDNLESERSAAFERSKVNHYFSDIHSKTVRDNRNINSNSQSSGVNNNETQSTNTGTKFKIPKIPRTFSSADTSLAARDKDMPVSITNKNNSQQLRNDTLSKRQTETLLSAKKTEFVETSKIEMKTDNTEKVNRISPLSEKNSAYRIENKLLTREGTVSERDTELSAIKKTESDKIHKISPKTDNTEGMKISPVSEISNKLKGSETSTKETVLNKRSCRPLAVKETGINNVEKIDFSPVSDKSDKCRQSSKKIVLNNSCSEPSSVKETDVSNVEKNSIVSDKNDKSVSKLSPKEILLNNRCNESLAMKETVPGRTLQMSANTRSAEEIKSSLVSDKNDKYTSKSPQKVIVLKNRHHESLAVKEMLPDRTHQMSANTSSIDKAKFSSVSDKNNKYTPCKLLPKDKLLNKRGTELLAAKETESSRILEMNVNTNIVITKFNSVSEKNKSGFCELSTKEVVMNKRVSDPLTLKETEPERKHKIDLKVGNSGKSEEIVLNKRNPLSDGNKTECNNNSKQMGNIVGQEHTITKKGGPPLLTKKKDGTGETVRKKIVLEDNPELKISTKCSDSSAERSLNCGSVKRKLPDRISIVPGKRLINISPEQLTGNQACSGRPETTAAASSNKECSENPTAGKSKLIAEGVKTFARKEAFPSSSENKESPPQFHIGETLRSDLKRTTLATHTMNKTATSTNGSQPAESAVGKKSKQPLKLDTLFAGRCMTYLKTSKCDPPCSLSHEVCDLLIESDLGDIQLSLSVLHKFVSEAACPPLSLVQNVCNIFIKYRKVEEIISISMILTRQSAQNVPEYMRYLLKILLYSLRECFGDTESSLAELVKYMCNIVKGMDSKQEVLDKVVSVIEKTVEIDCRWDIFSSLAAVEDYVWSEALLTSLCDEVMRKTLKDIHKCWPTISNYVSLLVRESHEKHLYNIWKRFPWKLNKIFTYAKNYFHFHGRILETKLKWFQLLDSSVNRYMSREEYSQTFGVTEETKVMDTVSQDVTKHPGMSFPPPLIENRNNSVTCTNRLLRGDNKEIVNTANSSCGSVHNLMATSSVNQKRSENVMITFNQPWIDPSLSGSLKDKSLGIQQPHLPGDSAVGNRNLNNVLRIKHPVCGITENCSTNTPVGQHEKTEGPSGLQKRTVASLSGEHQKRETNDGIILQKSCSSGTRNDCNSLGVLSNNKIAANYSNNNNANDGGVKSEPPSNKKMHYPRPSGYRQRLNQFNENIPTATAVCDDQLQQQQQKQLHVANAADEVNRTCVKHPLDIAKPCSSKSYNSNDNNDNYLSSEVDQSRENLLHVGNIRRLKRSNFTTDLRININNRLKRSNSYTSIVTGQQSSESACVKTENDERHLLDIGGSSGYLSDNGGGRCYPPQEYKTNAVYCSDVNLSSARNMVNRTNCIQQRQFQKMFTESKRTLDPTFTASKSLTTNVCNILVEGSQLTKEQPYGRGMVTDMHTETVDVLYTDSELNRPNVRPPPNMMNRAGTPSLQITCHGYQNENSDRGLQFNNEQLANTQQLNVVEFQDEGHVTPDCESSMRSANTRRQLSMNDFLRDVKSLENFLSGNDFHHVLNVLEKWQNTQCTDDLTKHLFVLLGEVNGNQRLPTCYYTYFGLMSTALNSRNLSAGMKKSLASVSLSLLLDMVVGEFWTYAYDIYRLLTDNDFPTTSCQVFTEGIHSPAKRNLVFAEICMEVGELGEAVHLLIQQNMLSKDATDWCLRSCNEDMVIRNELIKTLMSRTAESDNLELAYTFLTDLIEGQGDISEPVCLFRPYELLMRKLLDQTDYTPGLQLFKEVYSVLNRVVVYDGILCRALVVTCAYEHETELARLLVKKGYKIGAYTRNVSMFTVKISTLWTRVEIKLIIEETLSGILHHVNMKSRGSAISAAAIDSDLHFAVVEGDIQNKSLPKILLGVDNSVSGTIYRLKSVLELEFSPSLYTNDNSSVSLSPYIVVNKSVLVNYFLSNESL